MNLRERATAQFDHTREQLLKTTHSLLPRNGWNAAVGRARDEAGQLAATLSKLPTVIMAQERLRELRARYARSSASVAELGAAARRDLASTAQEVRASIRRIVSPPPSPATGTVGVEARRSAG